jgi:hypothetical protein
MGLMILRSRQRLGEKQFFQRRLTTAARASPEWEALLASAAILAGQARGEEEITGLFLRVGRAIGVNQSEGAEYGEAMVKALELVWGSGFLWPDGPDEVTRQRRVAPDPSQGHKLS